jgi:hypothetical protein
MGHNATALQTYSLVAGSPVELPNGFVNNARPLTATLECSFRNTFIVTNAMASLEATVPKASMNNAECTADYKTSALTYGFKPMYKHGIDQQCVYLNGKLLDQSSSGNDGTGNGGDYTRSFDATTDYIVSPPDGADRNLQGYYMTSKDNKLTATWAQLVGQHPAGACAATVVGKAKADGGATTYSVTQVGNYLQVKASSPACTKGVKECRAEFAQETLTVTCTSSGTRQTFCIRAKSGTAGNLGHSCVTGLFYDGQPMDLRPKLTSEGIQFSFTDTYAGETSFEIVRASDLSSIDNGEVVVKVPYGLDGCGRQFSSATFIDQEAQMSPGLTYTYGVRARKSVADGDDDVTMMKTTDFMVPWVAKLGVNVMTYRKGVTVEVCDLLIDDVGTTTKGTRCWQVVTNKFGKASLDLRIADKDYCEGQCEEEQHFIVTPIPDVLSSSCRDEDSEDADNLAYAVYDPPSMLTTITHLQTNSLEFTDMSAFNVTGEVIFDRSLVGGSRCPVAGATVNVTAGGESTTYTTDATGRFAFSAGVGDIVEVEIMYTDGSDGGVHQLQDDGKRMFKITNRNVHLTILDTTTKLLKLALEPEQASKNDYNFDSEELKWELTADVCVPVFTMPVSGKVDQLVPALAYKTKIVNAPELEIPGQVRAEHEVCVDHKYEPIIDFFTNLGNMERAIDLNFADVSMTYVYRTGMCARTRVFDTFPTSLADPCDAANTFESMETDDFLNISMSVYEKFRFKSSSSDKLEQVSIPGTITLSESVSGDDSGCHPSKGLVAECVTPFSSGDISVPIRVGPPTPYDFHMRKLKVVVVRSPYDYNCPIAGCNVASIADMDTLQWVRYVPVTGMMKGNKKFL